VIRLIVLRNCADSNRFLNLIARLVAARTVAAMDAVTPAFDRRSRPRLIAAAATLRFVGTIETAKTRTVAVANVSYMLGDKLKTRSHGLSELSGCLSDYLMQQLGLVSRLYRTIANGTVSPRSSLNASRLPAAA